MSPRLVVAEQREQSGAYSQDTQDRSTDSAQRREQYDAPKNIHGHLQLKKAPLEPTKGSAIHLYYTIKSSHPESNWGIAVLQTVALPSWRCERELVHQEGLEPTNYSS